MMPGRGFFWPGGPPSYVYDTPEGRHAKYVAALEAGRIPVLYTDHRGQTYIAVYNDREKVVRDAYGWATTVPDTPDRVWDRLWAANPPTCGLAEFLEVGVA